jgi:hypothetical protein
MCWNNKKTELSSTYMEGGMKINEELIKIEEPKGGRQE